MRYKRQVAHRRTPVVAMLAAVPYLLLSASQSVQLTTTINLDGSGLRQYTVSFEQARDPEVPKYLREATRDFDRPRRRKEAGRVVITRDWRPANLARAVTDPDAAASLRITDIIRKPLAVFTEYHWSEELRIYRKTATDVETAGEEIATLSYRLNMPGKIVKTRPNADSFDRGAAVWELSANVDTYTLEATSRRLRWGYLLLLLYIVGFVVFQVVGYGTRLIRNRPRKI